MELLTKEIFNSSIRAAESICLLGHVSPDGDCTGSCLAAFNYIRRIKGEDAIVQVYLEELGPKFAFMKGSDAVSTDPSEGKHYSLAVVCDCADISRLGRFERYYKNSDITMLVDHHFTNSGYGDYALVKGEASSCCEVLFGLMEEEYFDRDIASCIYTGLIHDTGVFRYSSTSEETMRIAGRCISKGIDFGKIVEDSFFSMTLEQKKVLGYILGNIRTRAQGRIVYSCMSAEDRAALNAEGMDMDGMIDQIRTTSGAMEAVFMYIAKDGRIKASLRSNSELIDVSRICSAHGGGGHKKAAGCFMSPDFERNMDIIEADFLEQVLNSHEQINNAISL
ncbi:MAG: DHH family phosphoesterase [Clostridiales bacterium]|nr:DHH family phosphoesterase [Clostridiales bacterium]